MVEHQNCPACDKPIKPPHASKSRYCDLFICSQCGIDEALSGDFWEHTRRLFKPTQPKGYNPWETET